MIVSFPYLGKPLSPGPLNSSTKKQRRVLETLVTSEGTFCLKPLRMLVRWHEFCLKSVLLLITGISQAVIIQ